MNPSSKLGMHFCSRDNSVFREAALHEPCGIYILSRLFPQRDRRAPCSPSRLCSIKLRKMPMHSSIIRVECGHARELWLFWVPDNPLTPSSQGRSVKDEGCMTFLGLRCRVRWGELFVGIEERPEPLVTEIDNTAHAELTLVPPQPSLNAASCANSSPNPSIMPLMNGSSRLMAAPRTSDHTVGGL